MKKLFVIGFLIAFLSLIPIVNAPPSLDLAGVPQAFSDALGISLFAGQMLSSAILVSFFLFPTMLLTSDKQNGTFAVLLIGILTSSLCVAIAWLPYWVMLVWVLLVALMMALEFKKVVS